MIINRTITALICVFVFAASSPAFAFHPFDNFGGYENDPENLANRRKRIVETKSKNHNASQKASKRRNNVLEDAAEFADEAVTRTSRFVGDTVDTVTNFVAGPKPGAWCGWWMRTQFGGGPEYNVARNWAKRGSATGPQVGAVVVWPHHVGYIVGQSEGGQWLVKSGNDGNAVRVRARSVDGAIAFRLL